MLVRGWLSGWEPMAAVHAYVPVPHIRHGLAVPSLSQYVASVMSLYEFERFSFFFFRSFEIDIQFNYGGPQRTPRTVMVHILRHRSLLLTPIGTAKPNELHIAAGGFSMEPVVALRQNIRDLGTSINGQSARFPIRSGNRISLTERNRFRNNATPRFGGCRHTRANIRPPAPSLNVLPWTPAVRPSKFGVLSSPELSDFDWNLLFLA
ncbi:hypothetical protein FPV67DRAFT_238556 [Lyophyllum atratum]|nr:hypothetical protein FPV67DRAFT_238556 [Lyophyllum atratum]